MTQEKEPRPRSARKRVPRALQRSEHDEQVALFAWREIAGRQHPDLAAMFAIPNAGGYRGGFKSNVVRVANAKREGVRSGVPDVMLPVARGRYHGLFVEMKRTDGVPSDVSDEQRSWLNILGSNGYRCIVAFGFEHARSAILDYLNLSEKTIAISDNTLTEIAP